MLLRLIRRSGSHPLSVHYCHKFPVFFFQSIEMKHFRSLFISYNIIIYYIEFVMPFHSKRQSQVYLNQHKYNNIIYYIGTTLPCKIFTELNFKLIEHLILSILNSYKTNIIKYLFYRQTHFNVPVSVNEILKNVLKMYFSEICILVSFEY